MIKVSKALGEIIERRKRYFTPDEMKTVNVAHGKLIALEEMEEQERLVILPCKVGDMVYYRRGNHVVGDTVARIELNDSGNYVVLDCNSKVFDFKDFGETAFLTFEEIFDAMEGESENGTIK